MHFPEDMIILRKMDFRKAYCQQFIMMDNKERYFVKRFFAGIQKVDQQFVPSGSKNQLEMVSSDWKPVVEIIFSKTSKGQKENLIQNIEDLISVKGIKACR